MTKSATGSAFIAAATVAVLLAGCGQSRATDRSDPGGRSGSGADCAALLEYDGHAYTGSRELKRDPDTTGRSGTGTEPGCADGDQPDRRVRVDELDGIPMSRAVLVRGDLYVRSDRPFPQAARAWLRAPVCDTVGEFQVRGGWLGVQSTKRVRFDGDLRPPYSLEIHVSAGPHDYRGATIRLHATRTTSPTLGPADVKTSLRRGGELAARVHCEQGAFVAKSLVSTPG